MEVQQILDRLKNIKDKKESLVLLSELSTLANAPSVAKILQRWAVDVDGIHLNITSVIPNQGPSLEDYEKIIGLSSDENNLGARKAICSLIPKLEVLDSKEIKISLEEIEGYPGIEWVAFNPTILPYGDGFIAIIRTVNYRLDNGSFVVYHPQRKIITRNFLLKLDLKFDLLQRWEIVDNLKREKYSHNVIGLEDCRLFESAGRIGFTCTTLDCYPISTPQISLVYLPVNWEDKQEVIEIDSLHPLLAPGSNLNRMEKNWLPFVEGEELHAYYEYSPITTIRLQPIPDKQVEEVKTLETKYNIKRFRGSAPPICHLGGRLFIVHEVLWMNPRRPIYTHRWMYKDSKDKVWISHQWYLHDLGVEFVSGLCWFDTDTLVITAGIRDCEAWIYKVGVNKVMESLFEIE